VCFVRLDRILLVFANEDGTSTGLFVLPSAAVHSELHARLRQLRLLLDRLEGLII